MGLGGRIYRFFDIGGGGVQAASGDVLSSGMRGVGGASRLGVGWEYMGLELLRE